MLFYPILYSFLPYFVTFTPTPQVEKTAKMPILPVLTIFVCVFPFFPLSSTYIIYHQSRNFFCSFLLLTSFALPYPTAQK